MEPFIGEIRVFSFPKTPTGWLACNGQSLPIQQNQALYALLGIKYGGNGTTNFNLPDLRGRAMMGMGTMMVPGIVGGTETVTLTTSQIPTHNHMFTAQDASGAFVLNTPSPTEILAKPQIINQSIIGIDAFVNASASSGTVALAADSIGATGGAPHENRVPLAVLNVCIASQGGWPPKQ